MNNYVPFQFAVHGTIKLDEKQSITGKLGHLRLSPG